MNINKIVLPESPNVLKSIRNGFDAITKHLVLLIFPVGFDLILWFAPHLQIKSQIEGLVLEMESLSTLLPADYEDVIETSKEIWIVAAERLNLFIAMRSLPVGIFSLFTSILPVKHPLGDPQFLDIANFNSAVLICLGLFLSGLILGGLYYSSVRQAALFDEVKWRVIIREWPRVSIQSFQLTLFWVFFFLGVLVVGSCLATGVSLFSFSLGQVVILLFGIISFWLVFPLFFSPHGIYSTGDKAWKSIITSIRLTNITFFKTGLFIMVAILINQGLNIIWQIPPEDSWLMVISVIGHAFVTTGMLSASFVYYQEMLRWMDEIHELSNPQPIIEERPTMEK